MNYCGILARMLEKVCGTCGVPKPLTDFFRNRAMRDGYLKHCKKCHKAHAEVIHQPRDPDKERSRLAAWRAAHPDQWKASRQRAQRKDVESGKAAIRAAKRRDREKTARTTTISLSAVLAKHGMVCGICRKPIEHKSQVTYDHVIPLSSGGAHSEENLVPAHMACNSWKGNRLPEELVGQSPPGPGEVDEWEVRRRDAGRVARSEAMKARMEAMTPEERAARGAKISAAKKGLKVSEATRAAMSAGQKGRTHTPDEIAKRAASNTDRWASKTPEELEAWAARCREIKKGSPGNMANLAKGHSPEVHARAIAASADARRGKPVSAEQKAKTSASLKAAYASGVRKAGHSEETKAKIRTTKLRKSFWKKAHAWLSMPRELAATP